MLFSVVFTDSYTATIKTSLTVGQLQGKVRGFADLHNICLGVIDTSEGHEFPNRQGIGVLIDNNLHEGLEALARGRIHAFVGNELIASHQVENGYRCRLWVPPDVRKPHFVARAPPHGSSLRHPINQALLNDLPPEPWIGRLKRYLT